MAWVTSEAAERVADPAKELPGAKVESTAHPARGLLLDTWQLDTTRARALWGDIVRDTYALPRSDEQVSGHRVRAQVWVLDDILLSRFEAEANSVIRTPGLVRKNTSELIKLKIFQSGHMDISDDARCATLGQGTISFIDHDRPSTQISSEHRQLSVFLPYNAIGFDPSRHPAWFEIGRGSAIGRLIEAGVTSVFESLDTVAASDASALAAGLAGLIRGALDSRFDDADASDFRIARGTAIRQFIEGRLGDPSLGSDLILKTFGVSRTTLYRDFEEYGGIQRFILQRRLHRAFRLLSENPPSRGVVGAVAERLGFASVHNFNRAFRDRFGEPPGAVVGRWCRPDVGVTVHHAVTQSCPTEFTAAQTKLRWAYERFRSAG